MRRNPYRKYFIIGGVLFLLLSLPTLLVEKVRVGAVYMLSSVFRGGAFLSNRNVQGTTHLEAENHLLRIEIGKLRALLDQRAKADRLREEAEWHPMDTKRYDEMHFLSHLVNCSVPARVIYRDPVSWSSSLWVNVGEETNEQLKRTVIQKNSPVIVGRAIVGAVDVVGKKQSRVRLITDVALTPSVRVARGFAQNMVLVEHLEFLLRHLNGRPDHCLTGEDKSRLIQQLDKWKELLSRDTQGWYLAKGILHGNGAPLWRSVNHTLRGIGFNYDFSDEEGSARELASGKPVESGKNGRAMPIIQLEDLLVTTGMDGVFPPGLCVGEVTKIYPLREGAYTYEIEASPVVGNLDNLQTVFIIPPLGFEAEK